MLYRQTPPVRVPHPRCRSSRGTGAWGCGGWDCLVPDEPPLVSVLSSMIKHYSVHSLAHRHRTSVGEGQRLVLATHCPGKDAPRGREYLRFRPPGLPAHPPPAPPLGPHHLPHPVLYSFIRYSYGVWRARCSWVTWVERGLPNTVYEPDAITHGTSPQHV